MNIPEYREGLAKAVSLFRRRVLEAAEELEDELGRLNDLLFNDQDCAVAADENVPLKRLR